MQRKTRQSLKALGFKTYGEYLASPHWRDVRTRYKASGLPQCCRRCGSDGWQLHHLTYDRLGHEELSDFAPLCSKCHPLVHAAHREGRIPLRNLPAALEVLEPLTESQRHALVSSYIGWRSRPKQKQGPYRPVVLSRRKRPERPSSRRRRERRALVKQGLPVPLELMPSTKPRVRVPTGGEVIVTRTLLAAGASAAGGWSRAQLAILGVPWPAPKGWKSKLLRGSTLTREQADRFLALRKDAVPAGGPTQ